MATESVNDTVIAFPRAKKRGPKVRSGPRAQVVRLGSSVAERYARLMTMSVRGDRSQAIAEYMDFSERLVAGGFTRADLEYMIACKRARLIRELREIDLI